MVMALHKAGIRVIMDVVYNHTAITSGGNFERTVPGYFTVQMSRENLPTLPDVEMKRQANVR